MSFLLGIDNGGTMVKAGLYDLSGNVVALSSSEMPSILGLNGEVERDLNQLWAINCQVIKDIISKSGVKSSEIIGISVAGHGNGIYLVDKDGKALGKGIYSTDMRAKNYVARFEKNGVCDRIAAKTMQTLYPGQMAPLLAWLNDNEPENLKKVAWALGCIDYLRYCLTGEVSAEITNMSASSLLNQETQNYDDYILAEMGISDCRSILPVLKQSCQITGHVNSKAALETGLSEGTPVAGGMIDITACAIATGITDESRLCLVAGTWSINEFISRRPLFAKGLLLTSVYCIEDYYMITDGSMTSANNLEWFLKAFFEKGKEKELYYEAAENLLRSTEPEDSEIVFLPFLYGTNADADAKSCFIGIDGRHSKAHMIRAVYEGVVFSHRMHIEKLLELRSEMPLAIRMAGGVTKSEIWSQMFADIIQLPIEISSSTELGTKGAAMCAGVSVDVFADLEDAAKVFSKVIKTYEPNLKKRKIYDQKYKRYKQVIKTLSPLWSQW